MPAGRILRKKKSMNSAQAKQIRIDEFLGRLGYTAVKVSEKRIIYRSMLSQSGDRTPSFHVSADGHAYYDWSTGHGGSIVDLAMYLLGTTSVSAALAHIDEVMGHPCTITPATPSFSFEQQKKSLEVSTVTHLASPALLRYAYSRGISPTIVKTYCAEVHYRVNGGVEYYSIGWPNNSGGWELRNAYTKLAAAPKDITVVNDLCGCTILVFEGFFDFLSAVSLGWFKPARMNAVVLNSTSLLARALPILSEASRVICLLDNDESGRRTTERIVRACPLAENHSYLFHQHNDLNDCLRAMNDSNHK